MVKYVSSFINNVIFNFLIAFGVIIGVSAFAGISALLSNHPPLKTMLDISTSIRIWAVAVALGGTFTTFEILEKGLLKGELRSTIKQAIYIVMALFGANTGLSIIKLIQKLGDVWQK